MRNYVNLWIVMAGYSYELTERHPNDPKYREWATREALAKYWNMGKRPYTRFDAR